MNEDQDDRTSAVSGAEEVNTAVDVAVVGAGPCGLAVAIAARRAGLSAVAFDRGPLVNGLLSYPAYMSFFSTAERLSIGDVPFVVATDKPTRRDALAYYRAVASRYDIDVRQYETVERVMPAGAADLGGESDHADTAGKSDHADTAGKSDHADFTDNAGTADTASTAGTAVAADGAATGAAIDAPARGRAARWELFTLRRSGRRFVTRAHAVVVATGYFGRPNRLGVPGEMLPHVAYRYTEGHGAWREPVVVVGGGNSAVDAALDLWRAGARVTLVHFAAELDAGVKPWVRPDILARISEGEIVVRFNTRVIAIEPEQVVVNGPDGESCIPATQVFTMTGYLPETGILEAVGVPSDAETGVPAHDPDTMATPLAGLYLAGVIASGNHANRIFIENGRDHGDRIVRHLLSQSSPG